MRTILLSVNPEYAHRIINGIKKFEYRKKIAHECVSAILIYSTAPEMMIIGRIEVVGIVAGSPTSVWEATKADSGITRKKYREYFKGEKKAYAYELGNVEKFIPSKSLDDYNVKSAPQSFIYIDNG